MRVLVLTQYFYPEDFRVNDLCTHLKSKGHQVVVLTAQPNYPKGNFFKGHSFFSPWKDNYEGIEVLRTPIFPRGRARAWQLALNYLSFVIFCSLFGLPRLRGKFDATFVFATSPITSCLPAIFYKFFTKTPVYLWVQDLWPESVSAVGLVKSPRLVSAIGRLVKFIYKRCDYILIQSKAFQKSVLQWGGKSEQIVYFPNWAEDFYQDKNPPSIEQKFPSGFNLLFAGNLGRAQSLQTIIKAAQILKHEQNINFIFLGEGSEKERLIQLSEYLDNVHFWPRRPAQEMPSYFMKASALLVSLKKDPIFSLVIPSKVQSYMACGRPIVAALDGEGAKTIQESSAGLVGPAENSEVLAKNVKILATLSEKETYAMAVKGHQYYLKHFDKNKVVQNLEDLITAQ